MLIAAETARRGVSTVVVERNERTLDVPKAGTLHARTAQSLHRRGYFPSPEIGAADLKEELTAPFHFAGMPGLAISGPAVEGPPIVGCPQGALERQFESEARRAGTRILRGATATAIDVRDSGVTVFIEGTASPSVEADYLVGADGARSLVRASCGFESDAHAPRSNALLGMVRLTDPFAAPAGWTRTERGWTVIGTNPFGHSRVAAIDFSGPGPDRNRQPTLEELRSEVSRIAGFDIPMTDPQHLDRFSDYSRLARTYRRGRVLLAGDAAHVHFPVGGQGLNLGVQDALNLGWKLALACDGSGDDTLLDSYDAERRPPAQRVVDNTRAQLALMNPDPAWDPLRDLFMSLMELDPVNRRLGDMISDQEVCYPAPPGASRWTGRFLPNLPLQEANTGRRTSVSELLTDGRPLLLLFDDRTGAEKETAAWHADLSVVRAEGPQPLPWTAVLVRPDGYLAWADDVPESRQAIESLIQTLTAWFGGTPR
ncbi:monooxygenase [Glycomyces buryatensis]|uniref:Monooxygenase n=2 Tax=Glycomyces buryatensis TaxID=2570927 RepID=A0A4S8QS32_9ACTN|nr:monooxygenase [Glycomyces buryatensis]